MKNTTLKSILFGCLGLAATTIASASYFDVPSSPSNVRATQISIGGCTLEYDTPSYDGGCPITAYLVEYKYNIFTRWQKISRMPDKNECKVTNMESGRSARFRVFALNEIGISEPSDPSDSIEFL